MDTKSPLLLSKVKETMEDIAARKEWAAEVEKGKMFGVLLARPKEGGSLTVLRAYSGQICGRSDWEGYVPAVYDYLQPDGYFKQQEKEIDRLNAEVSALDSSDELCSARLSFKECLMEAERNIDSYRDFIQQQKATRTIEEAQYQNAELRRIKQHWQEKVKERQCAVKEIKERINRLKERRRTMSDALQRWLFESSRLAAPGGGETRSVLKVFTEYAREYGLRQPLPPAGTGECCAPKLLHYANAHGLVPVEMAEFWYGASPRGEVRHHGCLYEPCQAKCVPLMPWLWPKRKQNKIKEIKTGEIETEEIKTAETRTGYKASQPLKIIYEDNYFLIINKPSGMLAVPGKGNEKSVEEILQERYFWIKAVHRLDMATSGLMLFAKSREILIQMQRAFAGRGIRKEYVAILDGAWDKGRPLKGTVSLPLSADFLNRPRQRVDFEEGKPAVTEYEVTSSRAGKTRILLRPLTGRTHQLRLHCAHRDGLNLPILGDELYGRTPAERMFLHAQRLAFRHPVLGGMVDIKVSPEW